MLLGALNTIDCRSQLKKWGHKSPAIYPYIHGSVFTSCFREAQSSLLLFKLLLLLPHPFLLACLPVCWSVGASVCTRTKLYRGI